MDMSLFQVRSALAEELNVPVEFTGDCIGDKAIKASKNLADGSVLLCENVRFHPGEEANCATFAQELAKLGDIYVNDAFSCAHRAHASTDEITKHIVSSVGPMLMQEMLALADALEAPKSPSVAVVGGAKVSSKISVLKNLVKKQDAIIIGGGMANTFLLADGYPVGRSLCEPDHIETVHEIRALAKEYGCELVLPVDVVCAEKFEQGANHYVTDLNGCKDHWMILDAGPASVRRFEIVLSEANTILWNGPLGAFEIAPFHHSTVSVAKLAAELTKEGLAVTVAGGGDTVAALNLAKATDDFSYVSAAGGAFLEWLEGKSLPGIVALTITKVTA
jgi:phosphoglycerate kinase